ncbi:MAG: MBL fold metallo-hydrolase [Pseudomonadota bacterium]
MRAALTFTLVAALATGSAFAHPPAGEARYIANEGVMVVSGEAKILFDPLFSQGFGIYREVDEASFEAIMTGAAPFDGVDAVVISHAHPDHFHPRRVAEYLAAHPDVTLYAPEEAIGIMRSENTLTDAIIGQIEAVALAFGDAPVRLETGDLIVEAVRIPHAGWPQRASVENLVWRVTLDEGVTVMHLGDADPDDSHFAPHDDHWRARETDMAFPPYWFFGSAEGIRIVDQRLNTREAVGVHVPMAVPAELTASGRDAFILPGETRVIEAGEDRPDE